MRKYIYITLFCLGSLTAQAQQMGVAVASFMDFPSSAHVAGLGGYNVSYMEGDDPMFSYLNPASLSVQSSNLFYLNGALHMVGSGYGSALYATKFSEKDAFAGSFQFAHYGTMEGMDEAGNPTGQFSAQDFAIYATYCRVLNKYFTIGVTLKPVISSYESYTTFSLGTDIGIQFTDTTHLVSAGLSVRNFGGQLAGPEDIHMTSKWMPINLAIGVTKRLKKAPLAFHLTLQNLQKWDYNYASNVDGKGPVSAGEAFARKIVLGIEVVPKNNNFWFSLAYNFDRGFSLANPYVFSVAGLTAGVGGKIKMVHLGAGVAFYNTAAVTAHFSIALDINAFTKKKL